MKEFILEQIKEASLKYNVPLRFLTALVATESEFNPFAFRHEQGYIWTYSVKECAEMVNIDRKFMEYIQKSSFGLCQLMGAVVYEYGFKGWIGNLFLPDINLKYACDHIHNLMKRHKLKFDSVLDVYASYNAGSPRKISGTYVNASAVRNFEKNYIRYLDII